MSNRKILVIGDSFANIDPEHSHWVDIWAKQHRDLSVEHFFHPGNNAVNIVSEFEACYKSPYDFDFAVFHVPDFFRSEVASNVNNVPTTGIDRTVFLDEIFKNAELLSAIVRGPDDAYKNLLPEYASKFTLEYSQIFYWLTTLDREQLEEFIKDKTPRDISIIEHTAKLYESASPRWIFRSNLTALKYFESLMKIHNIPCCFVLNPGHTEVEVQTITSQIDLPFWHMKTRSENIGNNHVSLTHAKECAILFEQYNNDKQLFLVDQ
jgi:hypothetical protein